MILESLKIFALFALVISILPLYIMALRNYTRSKRAVVEGMAQLDNATLSQLDWLPRRYISTFDLRAPFHLGCHSWGMLSLQQSIALQRVLLYGLPKTDKLTEETRKSARRYRRYSYFFVIPLAALILVPGYIRLSHDLASFSQMPLNICYLLLGSGIWLWVFMPKEKFKKWPEIGGRT
jgi:hypothetical protein